MLEYAMNVAIHVVNLTVLIPSNSIHALTRPDMVKNNVNGITIAAIQYTMSESFHHLLSIFGLYDMNIPNTKDSTTKVIDKNSFEKPL